MDLHNLIMKDNKYCKSCEDTPVINCGCLKLYSSNCVIYEGEDIEEYNIQKGLDLTKILKKLFTIVDDILTRENVTRAINIGSGIKILKGLNIDNLLEFKTLIDTESVKISQEGSEHIKISVDEKWIETKVETITSKTTIDSVGDGLPIFNKNNNSNEIRTIKSENQDLKVELVNDTIVLKSTPLKTIGDGIPVLGNNHDIKSIKSDTLYVGENNGSVEINTKPKYNWIAYANDIFGKDIGLSSLNADGTTKSYIGFAYNKNTEMPSMDYLEYTWVKLKGNDGHTGYVLDISNDNIAIPTDSEGKIGSTSLSYANSEIRLHYGNDVVPKAEYVMVIEETKGIYYTLDRSNPTYDIIKLTNIDFKDTTAFINISIYSDITKSEVLARGVINVVKLVGLDAYEILTSIKSIKVTQETNTSNEIIEPKTISAKIIKNTGSEIKETTEGILTYKYSYQLPMEKGTQINPDQLVTISNTNNPIYIEFNYYSPKNPGIVIDRETVPFVRDGRNGADGADGASAFVLDISNESHTIPTNSEGKTNGVTAYVGANSLVTLYKGESIVPLSEWDIEITQSGGITYTTNILDLNNREIVVTDVNSMSDTGYLDITAKQAGTPKIIGKAKFSIAKSKGTYSLKLQPSVNQIVAEYQSSGIYTITPSNVVVKLIKNDGNTVSEITNYDIIYKYNDSPLENNIKAGGTIALSYTESKSFLELRVHDKVNQSVILDKETIPFVKSGVPGVPGSRGPAIRQLEWREGYTYVNNNEFRDYIYYRNSDLRFEGWYVTKGVSAVANVGHPDLSLFEKQPFTESSIFGNIIAENANLAGFIFKNQQLFSQAGMEQVANPTFANMLINGSSGFIRFLQNFFINKEGIYFSDPLATTSNKNRLAIEFVNNTPRLRMWHPNGVLGIEMGIIDGELTLNFYDSDGNLVYKLGQGGIVYVDRVPDSYAESVNYKFDTTFNDTASLKTEYINNLSKRRLNTVNTGPNNKYIDYLVINSKSSNNIYYYKVGKYPGSDDNLQYQGWYTDKSHGTDKQVNGVYCIKGLEINDNRVFDGVRTDDVATEYNRGGFVDPADITNSSAGGKEVFITVDEIVNSKVVNSKRVSLGYLLLTDITNYA